MKNSGFSWVQTHEYIVNFLRDKQNSQKELVDLLLQQYDHGMLVGLLEQNPRRK